MEKSKVLVVGGTGYIGQRIAKASLAQGHVTYVLKRSDIGLDIDKLQTLLSLKKLGAHFVEGSFSDHRSLVEAVKKVDVVVCTMSGVHNRSFNICMQLKLVDAIKEAGNIKRFLPSEFGMDPARMGHAIAPGRITFDEKMIVRKAIEEANIPHTYVSANCFAAYFVPNLSQMGTLYPPKDRVTVYGDGNVKAVYVEEDDIATYTVKSIDDPRMLNKTLYIRPPKNVLSQMQLIQMWETLSGKQLDKIYISEKDFLASMEGLEYGEQVGVGHFYHTPSVPFYMPLFPFWEADWGRAFNFSANLDFLTSCIRKTKGDVTNRLCTAADLRFYFNHFFESGRVDYLKPNNNCNLTNWGAGCEPGWASSVASNQDVDLRNSKDIPARTFEPQPCCEGFFCPRGMTCMIPCPLGSYCPLATLNRDSGVCQPYNYQLPPAQTNHTCGGANIWADIRTSRDLFCSGGSYCPTSTQKTSCSNGHYCRMGSTSEKRCFKLTSCGPNTENQNIHAYGILLIAALSTLLLIMYNCSDQVLTTRERRLAKSRERAARNVHEKAKARERWKSAKEAAKKHASGLQAQISRTFSRIKSVKHPEHSRTDVDDDQSLVQHRVSTSSPEQQQAVFDGKKMDPSDIVKMIHAIDDDPDSFSIESGYKDMKRKVPKEKQIQTHSQIFNYAYSQLEKEKALQLQNKNLTFSGLVNMAAHTETIKRPNIEISFRELTLTLKGTSKQILRCVTGKIMPGHITAFMGPSGAGKTTFLSALAGKAVGCTITGSIHINGKAASIHSYRKITGFVPQDDVVHGNLTVEENIWFSASCRLSADLPKPDKVLIVERVIESLGLQEVRNSVVGTVEKRGISGGQRKRVNVGLEMVMEPSLLILDEPTSGLDSSSSQLLLRALRREALEGVNICMVVHQPSYTLFNMFDDLVLLAKGGLTVYHGPIRKVEEYFSKIGIVVPDRVNPPDYFIDVLEGIIKPNSGVSYKELPVRWMLHNDYPVPPDMQQTSVDIAMSTPGSELGHQTNLPDNLTIEHSFVGEMWQDVRYNVELQRDIIRHNLLRSKDLSNRKTPGIFLQYRYFLGRVGKQRLREARIQAIDYLILLLAGACLGSVTKFSDETFGAPGYTYTIIAVSLLCKIAALRSFSLDKLQYWRESASGISSLAHFLSKDTIDLFNTVIKPLVYLSMYYFFSNPRSSFTDNYVVLLCLVYCVTGMAYILAIFLEPGPSQLLSVLLPVVLTLVSTQTRTSEFVKKLANICYTKWALEAFVIANAQRYDGVWLITRCGALQETGYNLNHWVLRISLLILAGVISRIIAFIGMVTFRKK